MKLRELKPNLFHSKLLGFLITTSVERAFVFWGVSDSKNPIRVMNFVIGKNMICQLISFSQLIYRWNQQGYFAKWFYKIEIIRWQNFGWHFGEICQKLLMSFLTKFILSVCNRLMTEKNYDWFLFQISPTDLTKVKSLLVQFTNRFKKIHPTL